MTKAVKKKSVLVEVFLITEFLMNLTKWKQTIQRNSSLLGREVGVDVLRIWERPPYGKHIAFPLAIDKLDHPIPERKFPTAEQQST
ncbi:hypothetical protein A3197_01450 [Candidatus Thiodiazotropha endoloripes]|nr:hypothetical protein A3197_01450 [Candidatus Thiodiazotropha endoloripes]